MFCGFFERSSGKKQTNKTRRKKLVEGQLSTGLAVDPSSDDDAQLLKRTQWWTILLKRQRQRTTAKTFYLIFPLKNTMPRHKAAPV